MNLVGYAKTSSLEPGASETVTVEVPRYFLASYDENGAKTYILSQGQYYLTVGDDAHDAVNNILSAKGYTTFSKVLDSVAYDEASDAYQVTVTVTNTGDVAGKEVVEVYMTAPYTAGEIEKAHVVLVGFAKTDLIEPGNSD